MSYLTNEINALLVLRKLFEILPSHPVNLGKSYVIGSILAKECEKREKEFKKTLDKSEWVYLEYFQLFFSYLARQMPINSLFFGENTHQIMADIVANLVRDSSIGDLFIPEITGGDEVLKPNLRMRSWTMLQLCCACALLSS